MISTRLRNRWSAEKRSFLYTRGLSMNTRETDINQKPQCDCLTAQHGPWQCKSWAGMILPISDPSACNFVELLPKSGCVTQTQEWQHVSTLLSECCKNENNSTAPDLLMIGAIWVGNRNAAIAMQNYRQNLVQQGIGDVSSKYLFHVSQTWDDTVNICKKGFSVPTEYKPGRHLIGMGIYAGQPKYVANLTSDLGRGQRVNNEILTLSNPLIMIMCETIPGKSYPYPGKNIDGIPLMSGFNSHESVRDASGLQPWERCFFNADAIRPSYIIKVIRYKLEIQRYLNPELSHSALFSFFKKDYESFLEKRRHDSPEIQSEYDKRFGLVSRS